MQLKGGFSTNDVRLDRLPEFDERSRAFRGVAGIEDKPLRSYSWNKRDVLDQGQEGACVGFALTHELMARPSVVELDDPQTFAREKVYWPAQERDEWAGGSYPGASPFYEGTSGLAGAKVMVELGYWGGYGWYFGEHELALGVGYKGPSCVGIPWTTGMMKPDSDGVVKATGIIEGYHEILVPSISIKLHRYRMDNTWGLDYGIGGSCFISREDMAYLLSQQGDALAPVGRKVK